MALVCLGSCVFTIDSMFAFVDGTMGWDSSRVSAAIPSGECEADILAFVHIMHHGPFTCARSLLPRAAAVVSCLKRASRCRFPWCSLYMEGCPYTKGNCNIIRASHSCSTTLISILFMSPCSLVLSTPYFHRTARQPLQRFMDLPRPLQSGCPLQWVSYVVVVCTSPHSSRPPWAWSTSASHHD